jgi:hypothetical protein
LEFSLCTLTLEVQCLTFHQNHVVWQTKINSFWRNENDTKQAYYQTPIDKCRFNVTQLKEFFTFSVKDISIKLFYLYQRLQYTDNYFCKIKFVLFHYLLLSASWKENDLSWYISVIGQRAGYRTPVFIQPFSWRLHITITYNLAHLRLWYVDVVTVIA